MLAIVRIVATYNVFSHTYDESRNLAAGLERWSEHSYTLDVSRPPLARVVIAAAPFASGARSMGDVNPWREASAVIRTGGGYEQNLRLARFGVLPFFLLACWLVYWWGNRLGGPAAGAFGVVLFTLTPAVVAHAGLATLDMPLVATLLAASAAWILWAERPSSMRRAAALGAVLGAAAATKYSAIPYFLAVVLVSLFFLRPWRAVEWRELLRVIGVAAAAAVGVLWVAHGFSVGRVGGVYAPFPEFFRGLAAVTRQFTAGQVTYLFGKPALGGNFAYFPIVFLVKTPLALLVVIGLATVWTVQVWRRGGKTDYGVLLPLLMAAAVLVVVIAANINAGLRQILPVYAFLAIVAGAFVAKAWSYRRLVRNVAAGLLGVLLLESAVAHPDTLAYFNVLVPNERARVVVNSDLDWGQDLHRLRDTALARGITHLALAYHGTGDRARDVLPALRPVSRHTPDSGWVAISETIYRIGAVTTVGGKWVIDTTAYKWLRQQELVARVGKSIRLYRVRASVLQR